VDGELRHAGVVVSAGVGDIYAEIRALFARHPDAPHRAFRSRTSAGQYGLLYSLVQKYIPADAHVLDWGTGNGHFAYYLHRRGNRTTAYSLAECPVAETLQKEDPRGFEFVSGRDPEILPFGDGAFAAVASVGVLEHVRESGGNEVASLREIRRVLAPGGVFVCYHLPNRNSWIEAALRTTSERYHHPYRYTVGDVESMTAAAGLEVIELRRYGALPRNVLSRLPVWIRDSVWFAHGVDVTDRVLSRIVAPFTQSFALVAMKPLEPVQDTPTGA
jgi:SAM-dependent methyltransferase